MVITDATPLTSPPNSEVQKYITKQICSTGRYFTATTQSLNISQINRQSFLTVSVTEINVKVEYCEQHFDKFLLHFMLTKRNAYCLIYRVVQ